MPTFRYKTGSVRQVSERDAKILILLKKGAVIDDAEEGINLQENARVEEAQHEDRPKRGYKRKDMRAE